MKILIDCEGLKLTERIEERVEKKLAKFQRYFDDKAEMRVKFRPEGAELRSEITLKVDRHYYRAEAIAQQTDTAFDIALNALEGQIRKHKTKFEKKIRDYAYMKDYLRELSTHSADDEDDESKIRYKKFPIYAMTDEEAILQMEMLGHSFFLFIDPETGKCNVVYKRKNNSYGIIEPEY